MEEILEEIKFKLPRYEVDYLDLRIEERKGVHFRVRKGEVENIVETDNIGYGIRTLFKGRWGSVSGTDLSKLNEKIEEAISFAKLIGDGKTKFDDSGIYQDEVKSPMKEDLIKIPLKEKIDRFLGYYKLITNFDKKIQDSSSIVYQDSTLGKTFLNSRGSVIKQEFKRAGYSIAIDAREKNKIQSAFHGSSTLSDFEKIFGIEKQIQETCSLALNLLNAKPVKADKYTVICDQELTGLFVHEAFGHLSEADNVYKDEEMRKIMKISRKFGKDNLNIIDDPSMENGYGSAKYDDDGVLSTKNYLVRNGKLTGRLHSRETAGIMNEKPTGNSRAINYDYMPIVRMSNTYIDKGNDTFEDMIKDVKLGIYAKGFLGGQTNHENFIFSPQYGYMIRNGKLAEMVRDIKLSGNVFKTLHDIDMIGDDLELRSTLGGCGKGGQSPLPISDGGPHIRIQNVVIGGEQ